MNFPTKFLAIQKRLQSIDPAKYRSSRNFLNGKVTYLSPYLNHGVISTVDVMQQALSNTSFARSKKLIQELAWREFFHSNWDWHGEAIFQDLRFQQEPVEHYEVPTAILNAQTHIQAIDNAISEFKQTGYMHNQARLWLASLTCNLGRAHWYHPAKWYYFHVLDGDLASNTLSWQWVAGSFSNKKYYANQENVDLYSNTKQANTYLDTTYENLMKISIPTELQDHQPINLYTTLPSHPDVQIDPSKTLYLHHPWHLDPRFNPQNIPEEKIQRVLIFDPIWFKEWPMSSDRIDFITRLAEDNLPNIQIYAGSIIDLISEHQNFYAQDYPLVQNWHNLQGANILPQPKIFHPIRKKYNSFFAFWKACEKTDEYAALRKK